MSSKIGFCRHSFADGLKNGLYSSMSRHKLTRYGEHDLKLLLTAFSNYLGLSEQTFI